MCRNVVAGLHHLDDDPGMGLGRPLSRVLIQIWGLKSLALSGLLGLVAGGVSLPHPAKAENFRPVEIKNSAVRLQTDLPAKEAAEVAESLRKIAGELATQLGKGLPEPVSIVVVADLQKWPEDSLPTEARAQIARKAGTTLTDRLTEDGKLVSVQSTVYAFADGRTPQHEFVHAFCWQTFGRVGPDWFAEGIAEVVANRQSHRRGVQAPGHVLKYLANEKSPPTVQQIVEDQLGDRALWQKYAHRWALCYLLSHHPRYATRFSIFSQELLAGKEPDMASIFDREDDALDENYRQFLMKIAPGYEFPSD